jgi:S1-C subfamily serine protease
MSYDRYPPRSSLAGPASFLGLLVMLVIGMFVVFALTSAWVWILNRNVGSAPLDPNAKPREVAPAMSLAEEDQRNIDLFKKCSKSVVHITTARLGRDFNFNVLEIPRGTGSGFLWDAQGRVVTNYHVVEGAARWKVTLADQSSWNAVLVGVAPDKDLAVLKIDAPAERLEPILVGTSGDLQVGQRVYAIGNPFGLDQTLTTGIISGLGREIKAVTGRVIDGVIQTDAAINPGNSGGPLLDRDGRLIGVNTAIYSPSGASAGIGFAIPVDQVNQVVPQIVRHGKVIRPGMGVRIAGDDISRQLGLEGVLVINVEPGGGAEQAGVQPTVRDASGDVALGDVILSINGHKTPTVEELTTALDKQEAGNTVKVVVLRNAKTDQEQRVTMSVTLHSVAQ